MSELQSGSKLYTVAKLCERLQLPHGWIVTAIVDLGLKPALELNDLPYFTADNEAAIFEFHRKREIERLKNVKR